MAEMITVRDVKTLQEVCDFLKKAGVYYLATNEGTQPHVRPFGTANIYEGKLYIQTGKGKPVALQMEANPQIEISAMHEGEWIRLLAEVVDGTTPETINSMYDAYPFLKPADGEVDDSQVLYLTNWKATISSYVF